MEQVSTPAAVEFDGYLEVLDRSGNVTQRHAIAALPVSVGRAYDNDLVVADPYVCGRHLTVTLDNAGQIVAEDLDSVNGLFAAGSKQRRHRCTLTSGEPVRFGHSRLRYRSRSFAVAPALPDHSPGLGLGLLESPIVQFLLCAAALFTVWMSGYLGSVDRREVAQPLFDLIGPAGGVLVWAGLWTFAGRVMSHRVKFLSHCAIAASAILAVTVLDAGIEYVAFAFSVDEVRTALSALMAFVVLSIMMYAHLRFSTLALPRRLRVSATVFALVAVGLITLRTEISDDEFATSPRYEGTLKAPQYKIARTVPSEAYFAELESLRDRVVNDTQTDDE